jgi:hypothetical protein
VPQRVVSLEHAGLSTNDPWLAPGATDTRGNNVRAYADLVFPDGYTTNGDVLGTLTAADPNWSRHAYRAPETTPRVQLYDQLPADWFYDDG